MPKELSHAPLVVDPAAGDRCERRVCRLVSGVSIARRGRQSSGLDWHASPEAPLEPKAPAAVKEGETWVPPLPAMELVAPPAGWVTSGPDVPPMPLTLLRLPRTKITRARFPAIDFHLHASELTNAAAYQSLITLMESRRVLDPALALSRNLRRVLLSSGADPDARRLARARALEYLRHRASRSGASQNLLPECAPAPTVAAAVYRKAARRALGGTFRNNAGVNARRVKRAEWIAPLK